MFPIVWQQPKWRNYFRKESRAAGNEGQYLMAGWIWHSFLPLFWCDCVSLHSACGMLCLPVMYSSSKAQLTPLPPGTTRMMLSLISHIWALHVALHCCLMFNFLLGLNVMIERLFFSKRRKMDFVLVSDLSHGQLSRSQNQICGPFPAKCAADMGGSWPCSWHCFVSPLSPSCLSLPNLFQFV